MTVALIVGLACIGTFAGLAGLAQAGGGGPDGAAVALHRHALSHPGLVAAALATTAMGSVWAIGGVGIAASLVLARRRRFDMVACWLVGLAGGGVLRVVLKGAFQRPRPVFPDPLVVERSLSFPSGHVLGSVVCVGLLTYFARRLGWEGRPFFVIVVGGVALVTAIGMSRLYLGVHYPTDVLAAYIAGFGWLALWIGLWEAARRFRGTNGRAYGGVMGISGGQR